MNAQNNICVIISAKDKQFGPADLAEQRLDWSGRQ